MFSTVVIVAGIASLLVAMLLTLWGLIRIVSNYLHARKQPRGFAIQMEGEGDFESETGPLINTLFEFLPKATCRAGECGGCRLRLLEGEVAWVREPKIRIDRNAHILACSCEARSALRVAKP